MELGEVLQALQQSASELESIVYEFNMTPPLSVSDVMQDPLHSGSYYKLLELRQKENILSRELFTQEAVLKALNSEPVSLESNSTETLEERLKTLILNHKQNLLTATAQKSNDTLLLRRCFSLLLYSFLL